MARKPYTRGGDGAPKSPVVRAMANIAFDPSTPRKIVNRLDKLHDDDATEAAAEAKRQRKREQRAKLAARGQ